MVAGVLGVQVVGIGFGLFMLYGAFTAYKKGALSRGAALFWGGLWAAFLFAVTFPQVLSGALEKLSIIRLMDLFTIAGFLLIFGVTFYIHKSVEKLESQVREIAVAIGSQRVTRRLKSKNPP